MLCYCISLSITFKLRFCPTVQLGQSGLEQSPDDSVVDLGVSMYQNVAESDNTLVALNVRDSIQVNP
jgi:hypothetical protein